MSSVHDKIFRRQFLADERRIYADIHRNKIIKLIILRKSASFFCEYLRENIFVVNQVL